LSANAANGTTTSMAIASVKIQVNFFLKMCFMVVPSF